MRVYLALPSYDQRYWGNTLMSVLHCGPPRSRPAIVLANGKPKPDEVSADVVSGSLLPRVFNEALGRAVCRGFDVLAMIHSDIGAEPAWLTKMVAILERTGADVLSAVILLKDERELTSTAIHTPDKQFRYLSLAECHEKCGQVFGVDDPYLRSLGATTLLVNTGLMLMRLDRPWLRKWHGFQIRSRIVWQPNELRLETVSEDWDMSEQLTALGCNLTATTAVQCQHWGGRVYASAVPNRVGEGMAERVLPPGGEA